MKVKASIDIGSNSVLLLVAEVGEGLFNLLKRESEITSLGKGLDKNGVFADESMQATLVALKSFVSDAKALGVNASDIIATATEASRVSKNAKDFFKQIKEDIGLNVQIITSEAEAMLTAKGILSHGTFETPEAFIMDIGGASTELIKVNTKTFEIIDSISMPVGSVRSTEWLAQDLFVQNLQKIFIDYRAQLDRFQTKDLYCVAGTMTSIGNMFLGRKDFVEDDVHGLVIKGEDIDKLFKKFSQFTPEEFLAEFPFLQKRSQSIKGGLHLTYHILHRLLVKEVVVSTFGLRYGSILEEGISHGHLQYQ